ncbi:type II secretion system protein J [Pedobacter vanadiisoli]|uniref:Type II secretion system protein J n=1 Tax=Pedobacter vanadiisoli TaxID=1761975 RepID=A0ABW5MEE0_9SPHI
MKAKKIEAYTLMEIAIAMLLAAICMSICYTAYSMIGDYFRAFQKRNAAAEEVLTLRRTMERDIAKGRYLVRTAEGVQILADSLNITYQFADTAILRKVENLHTDSFHVRPVETSFLFEKKEALETDTVDRISFMLKMEKQQMIPITLGKFYSAHDLLK